MLKQREIKRLLSSVCAVVLVLGMTIQVFLPGRVFAAPAQQITSRSLTLEPGATAGGSDPGGTVNHLFNFTLHDLSDPLGSIVFQYCTTAAAVSGGTGCIAPTGISTSSVTLGTDTGATGFTATTEKGYDDAADNVYNAVLLSRTAAALGGSTPVAVSIELDSIVNPTTANQTFFVRIWTFSTTTGGTLNNASANDSGTVAASTANPIVISGTMPESLVFCTGETVSETSGVPDCTTATAGNINFNQLFSPTSTAYTTSQMAASTNAGSGYAITTTGATLTSGSNTINAMSTAGNSTFGISQFGLNLVLNDGTAYTNAPNINTGDLPPGYAGSANVTPVSNGTNYNATVAANFATNGTFAFTAGTPNVVASSNSKGTDAQIYTASYIVNVPGSQPAGTYTTTLTYICTPTF